MEVNSRYVYVIADAKYSRTPLIRTLVIQIGLVLRVNLSRILQKLTCHEITSFRMKYSTVLWLLELEIRRVDTVKRNNRTSNCHCSPFYKKNPIVQIFCISEWLDVPNNPDKCSSTVVLRLANLVSGRICLTYLYSPSASHCVDFCS